MTLCFQNSTVLQFSNPGQSSSLSSSSRIVAIAVIFVASAFFVIIVIVVIVVNAVMQTNHIVKVIMTQPIR